MECENCKQQQLIFDSAFNFYGDAADDQQKLAFTGEASNEYRVFNVQLKLTTTTTKWRIEPRETFSRLKKKYLFELVWNSG